MAVKLSSQEQTVTLESFRQVNNSFLQDIQMLNRNDEMFNESLVDNNAILKDKKYFQEQISDMALSEDSIEDWPLQ